MTKHEGAIKILAVGLVWFLAQPWSYPVMFHWSECFNAFHGFENCTVHCNVQSWSSDRIFYWVIIIHWSECYIVFSLVIFKLPTKQHNNIYRFILLCLQTLTSVQKQEIFVRSVVSTHQEHIAVFVLEDINSMLTADTVQVCLCVI